LSSIGTPIFFEMSTNIPVTMQFCLGAAGNFPVVAVSFKEICIKFGVPGQEIIRGDRIPLVLPAPRILMLRDLFIVMNYCVMS